MAIVVVVMDPVAMRFFTGWDGEIGRSFYVLAQQVRAAQVAFVPKKTGRLAASITVGAKNRDVFGITVDVGAGAGGVAGAGGSIVGGGGYAQFTELGTRRHSIRPRNPDGWMVFYWPKVGHVVYRKHVNHPGNRAYNWANRGMLAAVSRWV